jgi:hypothetical protein
MCFTFAPENLLVLLLHVGAYFYVLCRKFTNFLLMAGMKLALVFLFSIKFLLSENRAGLIYLVIGFVEPLRGINYLQSRRVAFCIL